MISDERAIYILEQRACCRECLIKDCTCVECDEAFDLAIKAIKQMSKGRNKIGFFPGPGRKPPTMPR